MKSRVSWGSLFARSMIALALLSTLLASSSSRADQPMLTGAGYFYSLAPINRFLAVESVDGQPATAYYAVGQADVPGFVGDLERHFIRFDCVAFSLSPGGAPQFQASGPDVLDPSARFYVLVIDRGLWFEQDRVEVHRFPSDGACGADTIGFPVGDGDFAIR